MDHDGLITTPLGLIRGTELKTWTGKQIHAYRGIRYAKAPIGVLRFKAPVPVEAWSGVLDATKDGPMCPQPGATKTYGSENVSEDCLHLSVYTKKVSSDLPVIVYFHSGGWFSGTSRSDWLGPDYLLDEDIVLVTVNYRLGPLGFLCTGDEHAVGNYGLKDQVMALKWVKENIKAFGGNPNWVTIAGYSAGSISVLLHILSPMSKGLFKRGIAMGGGVLSNSLVRQNHLEKVIKLADVVGCPKTSSTKELLECLRKIPANTLAESYIKMKEWACDPIVIFSPVIEPLTENAGERFLIDSPTNLIKSKCFMQVPLLMGITKDEFDFRGKVILENESWLSDLNTSFEKIAPIAFGYDRNTTQSNEFSKKLRNFYLGDGPIKKDNKEFGKMYSDSLIIANQELSAKLFAKHSDAPVFFYMTTYNGRFSYAMDEITNKPLGVVHQDELIYLFYNSKRFSERINPCLDPEARIVRRFCNIWYTFTRGSPPGDAAEWHPIINEQLQYLEIGDEVLMKPGLPYTDRVALWETIYSRM